MDGLDKDTKDPNAEGENQDPVVDVEDAASSDDQVSSEDNDKAAPADDADGSEKPENKDDDPEDKLDAESQAKANYAFQKKQRELKEERQKAEEAVKRAEAAEAKLKELTAPKRPEIPEMPSAYDPDYEAKVAARDKAIRDQAAYDADIEKAEEDSANATKAAHQARLDDIKAKQDAFDKKATEYKITTAEKKEYEDSVSNFISKESAPVAEYLLGHEEGPLLCKYLHGNVIELEKVMSMNPMQAAVYIEKTVAPKAVKLKPDVTNAPAPHDTLDKKGAIPTGIDKDPYVQRATFE